ncbi:unnamed protein product [Moneuplotes crassus]|uniref:Cyclic nucleotide-binding domain-containing protein n=1 Tax=Euplotes crassus TaxID=5936 RepID=A0AAD1Y6N6_EUPCR|nr:unnamed protein product [Moneuplotes crassus]
MKSLHIKTPTYYVNSKEVSPKLTSPDAQMLPNLKFERNNHTTFVSPKMVDQNRLGRNIRKRIKAKSPMNKTYTSIRNPLKKSKKMISDIIPDVKLLTDIGVKKLKDDQKILKVKHKIKNKFLSVDLETKMRSLKSYSPRNKKNTDFVDSKYNKPVKLKKVFSKTKEMSQNVHSFMLKNEGFFSSRDLMSTPKERNIFSARRISQLSRQADTVLSKCNDVKNELDTLKVSKKTLNMRVRNAIFKKFLHKYQTESHYRSDLNRRAVEWRKEQELKKQKEKDKSKDIEPEPLKRDIFQKDLFSNSLIKEDFTTFCRDIFPEIVKKMKLNPFQVCELPVANRNANDEIVLKSWLRNIDFFLLYPELIMDRVCEKLAPVNYREGKVVMGKGDKSEFMIVIYSGDIGIYLQTVKELENTGKEGKCIAQKGAGGVLGEAGLLKEASRGATCIALTDVKALYLSASNYCQIVESFHKSELYKNIEFNKSLDFLKDVNYAKARLLAQSYNSTIFKKGQVVIDANTPVNQLYIVKDGILKVEKKLELRIPNVWPSGYNKWEIRIVKRKVIREIAKISSKQVFGLHELISKTPINCKIICESERAHILTINSTDLFMIMSEEEILASFSSENYLIIPNDLEIQ